MRAVLKNNMHRLWVRKQLIVLLMVFTLVATAAAIFVSTGLAQTWDVAIVGEKPAGGKASNVNFIELTQTPRRADLVSGKYDAILTIADDGSYKLDTIKSADVIEQLMSALDGQSDSTTPVSDRGIGTNVLGYLMMFILLMGSMAMCMYADDQEQKQITRVAASPVSIKTYLFAHSLFNFCFLFFPTMLILLLVQWVSGITLGYSLLKLTVLIAILCAFATAFCLVLFSFLSNKADSAIMAGNTVIILTSILAGGFYAFDKGNHALGRIITILPQKAFLTLADLLEQGTAFTTYLPVLVYLLAIIVVFYTISVVKVRHMYVNKH